MDFEKLKIIAEKYNNKNKFISEPLSEGYNVFGYFSSSIGLSQNSRYISYILDKNNINFSKIDVKKNGRVYSTSENIYDKNIVCINPDNIENFPKELLENRYNIALWAWELNQLPKSWIEASKYFDEIWTVSDFCKKIFESELGSDKKIKVVRVFPYWVKKENKNISRKKLSITSKDFIFLFILDYNSDLFRKNVKDLIYCFEEEFSEEEDVSLYLKIRNLPKEFDLKIKSKKIYLIDNEAEEDNNYLLNSCDCYISLHRSEGYGLTVIESIILGKPVICTNYSGIKDFCNENYQELVDFDFIQVDRESYYMNGFEYHNENNLKWAQPNLLQVRKKMRKIFNDINLYNKKSDKYRKEILNYNIFEIDFL